MYVVDSGCHIASITAEPETLRRNLTKQSQMISDGSERFHFRKTKKPYFQSRRVLHNRSSVKAELGRQFGGTEKSILFQREVLDLPFPVDSKTTCPGREFFSQKRPIHQ